MMYDIKIRVSTRRKCEIKSIENKENIDADRKFDAQGDDKLNFF